MNIYIKGIKKKGIVNIKSSKSIGHRALICGAFSRNLSKRVIKINDLSQDILATISALKELGFSISIDKDNIYIGQRNLKKNYSFNFNESASSLRFFLSIIASLGITAYVDGKDSLKRRPIGNLMDLLRDKGIYFSNDKLPFTMKGKIMDNRYKIEGKITSQYLSGLLLSSPLIDNDKEIEVLLDGKLNSRSYVDITCKVMKDFNIDIDNENNRYIVKNKEYIQNINPYIVEGDWSNGMYFIVLGLISHDLIINNLSLNSLQADRKIIDILKDMDGNIYEDKNSLIVKKSKIRGGLIDLSNMPDLLPILAILASQSTKGIGFKNIDRLRYKESDRIKTTIEMIKGLGGNFTYKDDLLYIYPSELKSSRIDSFNDHRIQMALSIASFLIKDGIYIKNANAYKKSYPSFYKDLEKVGGIYVFH